MARRSRSKSRNGSFQRDAFDIASGVRPLLEHPPLLRSGRTVLLEIEDRRLFRPSGRVASVASYRRPNHLLGAKGMKRVRFHAPKHIVLCVRRKERKEVLHAKGVAGGRVSGRRRRNSFSSISC